MSSSSSSEDGEVHWNNLAQLQHDLTRYQQREAGLRATYAAALGQWENRDRDAAQHFRNFIVHACLAASSTVGAVSIASWYPVLPRRVGQALMALVEYLHGEAYLIYEKATMEIPPTSDTMHEEVQQAAAHTTLERKPDGRLDVTSFAAFGLGELLHNIGEFDDYTDDWYQANCNSSVPEWKHRLTKIRSNFWVRKTVKHVDSPLRCSGPRRPLADEPAYTRFLLWVDLAVEFLEGSLNDMNDQAISDDTRTLFTKVYNEIGRAQRPRYHRVTVESTAQGTRVELVDV